MRLTLCNVVNVNILYREKAGISETANIVHALDLLLGLGFRRPLLVITTKGNQKRSANYVSKWQLSNATSRTTVVSFDTDLNSLGITQYLGGWFQFFFHCPK
jgi:hypothetical protein